jgi:ubiquinol-cytochrome c reductase cytochrome b subunit
LAVSPVGGGAPAAEQGVPDPLVVPAGRDRAVFSFIVLLITGVYLTLFFDPSMAEVTYNGVYQPLRGVEMSKAFASALDISFEVRGGLFVRQVHHWAALMFAAAIMVHLARIFFTGRFAGPAKPTG